VLYSDVAKAQAAINDVRAQFRRPPAAGPSLTSLSQEERDPIGEAWKSTRDVLVEGVGQRSIKTDRSRQRATAGAAALRAYMVTAGTAASPTWWKCCAELRVSPRGQPHYGRGHLRSNHGRPG
jgi:hypothetical protein